MGPILSFRGILPQGDQAREILFLFSDAESINSGDVDRALTDAVREDDLHPDLIIHICAACHSSAHNAAINSDLVRERLQRLTRCQGMAQCDFDTSGSFAISHWLTTKNAPAPTITEDLVFMARQAGLELLSQQPGVLTDAPPGTYFLNPSQGRRSYFIRAAPMCRTSVEASFVAFCLLPLIAEVKKRYGQPPNVIWVDTVGIAYVAFALAELGHRLGAFAGKPQIRSFSSYSGIKAVRPAPGEYPVIIISASTSGGLAREITEKHSGVIVPEAIATILGAFDETFPRLLYRLPHDRCGAPVPEIDTETLRPIRVAGEDFLFTPGETAAVMLNRRQVPPGFQSAFVGFQGKGLVHYFKRASGQRPTKPFLFDSLGIVEDEDFKNWLKRKATGTIPASVRHVVHQDDIASARMANQLKTLLQPLLSGAPIKVWSVSDLEKAPPDPEATVAVVAAVVGSGMELMRVTRALRAFQAKGSRYFLLGGVAARTNAQLEQIKSNLRLSDEAVTYTVEAWGAFAPGADAVIQMRVRELEWLGSILYAGESGHDPHPEVLKFAEERLKTLQSDGVLHADAPRTHPFVALTTETGCFHLSDGFALWRKGYKRDCPEDVLFTVACWLQRAREAKDLRADDRLDGGGFGQVVLAPDFLLRFTDPVIQASILRCARDAELDYRSSRDISARASEIASKLLLLKEKIAAELLLSLALGRMRLRKEHLAAVCEVARAALAHSPLALALVLEVEKRT